MSTATSNKSKLPSSLPLVTLAVAEQTLRSIAKREGEGIRKRRSGTMIEHFGEGYMVYEPMRNLLLSGSGGYNGQDGCGDSLADVALRYEGCEDNTNRQNQVIASIKAGLVKG